MTRKDDEAYMDRKFKRVEEGDQPAIKVRNNGEETHWVNIPPQALARIRDIVVKEMVRESWREQQEGGL